MYSTSQKQEIEKAISVFKDYIQSSDYLDLVWSDKLGYLLLNINPPTQSVESEPLMIESGADICKAIFDEISLDVYELTKNEDGSRNSNPLEKAEILRRIEPFIKQLPEYRHLVYEMLESPEK